MKFVIWRTSDRPTGVPGVGRDQITRPGAFGGTVVVAVETLDVPDLAGLVALSDAAGSLIVNPASPYWGGLPNIEIYDQHRE